MSDRTEEFQREPLTPNGTVPGTTTIRIDWACVGIDPASVERRIDEEVGDLIERMSNLIDLDDPGQGIGVEASVRNYRRMTGGGR